MLSETNKIKDPNLKLRYARGLGDIIACILHSKAIGWLTKLITGKNKPCKTCSKRAYALNLLFPIPLWKFYFKNEKELMDNFYKELKNAGYEVNLTKDKLGVSASKTNIEIHEPKTHNNEKNIKNKDNYVLVTSGENYFGEYILKTQIFKRI